MSQAVSNTTSGRSSQPVQAGNPAGNGVVSHNTNIIYPSGKKLTVPASAEKTYQDFIQHLQDRFDDTSQDNNDVVLETLSELYLGDRLAAGSALTDASSSAVRRAAVASLDPRNVTLEPEHYSDIDVEKYAVRKPLIWLWQQFDRSPLGGNLDLGFRLKRLLASRIFKHVGSNLKVFPFVEFSYGYNLSIGDDVVVHRHVLLDDRGEIEIGNRVSLSDYVEVFSHSHHAQDIRHVELKKTIIGDDARITYHSTVLAGSQIGRNAILGTYGLATKPVADDSIAVGIPARTIRSKGDIPKPTL